MKSILLFGAGSWATFVVAALLSVYALDSYEHAWGRFNSLQVEVWLSLVGALVAMGTFGISAAVMRRAHSPPVALSLGVGCTVLFLALCWGVNSTQIVGGVYIALCLLMSFSAVAAHAGNKVGG